ncbi:MAG TPA: hypothetical protein H9769_05305 [Candidatus Microbacterium pullistercoris]|nr:hypothetical protein [Candidatus Microbacterium pullistercoris]
MSQSPMFAELVPLAQPVVYDAMLTHRFSVPTDAMLGVDVPVTIPRGQTTFPALMRSCDDLHAAMPASEFVVDAESSDHDLNPPSIAEIVRSRV